MALGHYMREKSTESKGVSPAESTQTAETIESGSAGTAGKTRKGGQKQGKKPKGESRNKYCLDPHGLDRRFFGPVGKAFAIWLKISSLPGNRDSSIPGLKWNRRAKVPLQAFCCM